MTYRWRFGALVLVLTAAIGALVIALQPNRRAPSILFITIDTLRADAIGVISATGMTPEMDRLASEGFLFDQMVSAVPLTGPSHASLLSGQAPWRHGVRNNGQRLPQSLPWLPELLQQAGYDTAGFISAFPLNRMFGFERGLQFYDDDVGRTTNGLAVAERKADQTSAAVIRWLERRGDQPFFAWVHYYDPHAPYEPPDEYRQPGPRGDYLGEVAYVDSWIGKLVHSARQVDPDVIVVITSDHGEGLGDHDESDHGLLLYQSTLRVPAILVAPGRIPSGRSGLPARSIDLVPTLLSLTGIKANKPLDGVDLAAVVHGDSTTLPPAYSESYFGALTYGWAPLRSMREHHWKRIEGAYPRAYDLAVDTGESSDETIDEAANARLESLLADVPDNKPADAAGSLSTSALARLRSLGYLSAGASHDARRWRNDVDPESGLIEHNAVLAAQQWLDQGDIRRAESAFRTIADISPGNRVAWQRLGELLLATRRTKPAAEALQRAVELDPFNPEARYQLASALTTLQRYRDAAAAWSEVVRLQPSRSVAWSNLGSVLLLDGQSVAAIEALTEANRLAPEDSDIRENLGRAQITMGDVDGALRALQMQPQQQPAHRLSWTALLAVRLAALDRFDEAESVIALADAGMEGYVEAQVTLARGLLERDESKASRHLDAAIDANPSMRSELLRDPVLAPLIKR